MNTITPFQLDPHQQQLQQHEI